jgi:alginate O-acetyltransferase complex protein AlgI
VYIPLGGNQVGQARWMFNILVVFLLSGLWHGANWTFVVWGALHGFMVILSRISAKWRDQVRMDFGLDRKPHFLAVWQVTSTFVLVTVAWVFFRAETFGQALLVLDKWRQFLWALVNLHVSSLVDIVGTSSMISSIRAQPSLFAMIGLVILFAEFVKYNALKFNKSVGEILDFPISIFRWTTYFATMALVLLGGEFGSRQFIYFQF